MSLYTHEIYILTTLSNTHPGSGDANFGIIDNLIQRDPITSWPTIHSSSLKGSIREHCEIALATGALSGLSLKLLFGSDSSDTADSMTGQTRFYESKLLCVPVRGSHKPFYRATTPAIAAELLDDAASFGISLPPKTLQALMSLRDFSPKSKTAYINSGMGMADTYPVDSTNAIDFDGLEPVLGNNIAVFDAETFGEICSELPTIARNAIGEDGTSENLFYEEVLPRQCRFAFILGSPSKEIIVRTGEDAEQYAKARNALDELLTQEGSTVQIGAHASIGYGACQVRKLS
ncbi:MAG: type III-B CRISPR module RAMP protein Cmr4 [Sulfuricurvum sp.]